MSCRRAWTPVRGPVAGERGFTLIEVMLAIVLLTFGLLAVADVFPQGLALGRYGKDQTTATGLAQQEIECLKPQSTSTLGGFVGDYGNARTPAPTVCNPNSTAAVTSYFDQYGTGTTQTAAYFTRDVQVQYWTWSNSTNAFTLPASPYAAPGSGTASVYRI